MLQRNRLHLLPKMAKFAHGPWGLMVVFSAFMIQLISFGISSSIGVYNIEFLDYFTNDAVAVSLVASINIGCFQITGPLVSFLMTRFSHRSIVLIGSIFSFIGLIVTPWLPSLPYLYVFYGVLTGVGYCFVFIASQVLSSLYFEEGRSLAAGIATSGSCLGTGIFPILIGNLIQEYTWRGSLFLLAGISLNIFALGLLLRPLPSSSVVQTEVEYNVSALSTKASERPLKNYRVFTSFCFDVFFINNIFYNMTASILIAFGPEFFTTKGLSNIDAAFQLTVGGLAAFFGAILGGLIGNIQIFNRLGCFIVACMLQGVACCLLPLVSGYGAIAGVTVMFGIFFGINLGLLVIVTTDILGSESMGDGIGYLMLANGIGSFLGPVLAGYMKETYGSYESSLYMAGFVAIGAGILLLLIPLKMKLAKLYHEWKKVEPPRDLPGSNEGSNDDTVRVEDEPKSHLEVGHNNQVYPDDECRSESDVKSDDDDKPDKKVKVNVKDNIKPKYYVRSDDEDCFDELRRDTQVKSNVEDDTNLGKIVTKL